MPSVLHIGGESANLREVLQQLSGDGIVVREVRPDRVTDFLREGDSSFDAAVIDAQDGSPVAAARSFHDARPDAQIIFVTEEASDPKLQRQLMLAPRIGSHWTIVNGEEQGAAADAIRKALHGAARRRQHRTTISRLNVRLARPEVPPRRRIITDQFIAAVFDQLSDAVVMLDPAGRVLVANASAAAVFGRNVTPEISVDELVEGRLAAEGELAEVRARRSDGREVILEVRVESVHDEQGRRVGSTLIARNVTQRHNAERRRVLLEKATVRLSEARDVKAGLERLAELVVESLAAICVVDVVDGPAFIREAAAAEPGVDRDLLARLATFSPRQAEHPAFRALQEGTIVRNGLTLEGWRRLTNSEEHFGIIRDLQLGSFLTAPLKAGQKVIGAMSMVRRAGGGDFTPGEVELAEELARRAGLALQNAWLLQTAEQANRAKDEFLATLSHELRTPMTSILGWVQMLRLGGLDDASVRDGLDVMEQSARVQAQLIDDLLDLSRGQMGKLHLETTDVELGDIIRAAIETLRPAANAKNITLDLVVDHEVTIIGDPNRLQQVIWNLLSNALKFTEKGGRVSVCVDVQRSKARVIVTDSGRGIEPEFLPYVFERFRQADSATTRRFGGLGLGLAIVKQIVELHGGSVSADSRGEGHGAAFTVFLPVPAVLVAAEEAAREVTGLDDLSGRCVLVVDDDRASLLTISRLLERAGAEVEMCNTVPGALELLRARLPDVLISDIAMPGEDGFALIRQVRSTLRIEAEQMPAIALTAFGDTKTRVAILGAGFQRHLQKPVDAAALVRTVIESLT